MSTAYDEYLRDHKDNVAKGLNWMENELPEVFKDIDILALRNQVNEDHDRSKFTVAEYEAYDDYFYGESKTSEVREKFNRAWLHHIHRNPHHWQHWVLINDEPGEGEVILDMDYDYIVEMICDWWAFSWKKGELWEIFSWYDQHKAYMKLSNKTRKTVEDILDKMRERLDNIEFGEKYGV